MDFASEDETQCDPCGKIFRGNKQSEKNLSVTLKESSEKLKKIHEIDVASKGQKAEIQSMRERVKIHQFKKFLNYFHYVLATNDGAPTCHS